MSKRTYTPEFKREAASMIIIEGMPVKDVSQQLGINENQLYRWKAEHLEELEAAKPEGARSPKAMADEITQLRKELAKSKRMNEILKKTVGYFSKDD